MNKSISQIEYNFVAWADETIVPSNNQLSIDELHKAHSSELRPLSKQSFIEKLLQYCSLRLVPSAVFIEKDCSTL